jgi:hypothetical protein
VRAVRVVGGVCWRAFDRLEGVKRETGGLGSQRFGKSTRFAWLTNHLNLTVVHLYLNNL